MTLSFQPSPFFVLDEVDAALDNTNVAKIANYIRQHASETFQFIVISLKGSLYEKGNSLVGIYRDQDVNSSRTLTLDVSDIISAMGLLLTQVISSTNMQTDVILNCGCPCSFCLSRCINLCYILYATRISIHLSEKKLPKHQNFYSEI
jgi:hypothetical protein